MLPRTFTFRWLLAAAFAAAPGVSADCPVTLPSSSLVDLPTSEGRSWYGSDALAVQLRDDGQWPGRARHRYMDKLSFWRRGYVAATEVRPDLILEGTRLSGPADGFPVSLREDRASNAMGAGSDWMMMGMTFPSAGCWEIRATYTLVDIKHELTFVVNVIDVDAN